MGFHDQLNALKLEFTCNTKKKSLPSSSDPNVWYMTKVGKTHDVVSILDSVYLMF